MNRSTLLGLNNSLLKNLWGKLKTNLNLSKPAIAAETSKESPQTPDAELSEAPSQPSTMTTPGPETFNIDAYKTEFEKKIEQEYSKIFTNSSLQSWSFLISNANNGRTHALGASNILKKTIDLVNDANASINEMLLSTIDISETIADLQQLSNEITLLSDNSKIVSLNAYVEAAKAADKGKTFAVVANELGALSGNIKKITNSIQTSLTSVDEKVVANKNLCFDVADLFLNVDEEMKQLNKLMMRIEELSISQSEPFHVFETKMNPNLKKKVSGKGRSSATSLSLKKVA
jgi:hypothetical protein